jgi:hypothetical protein
MKISDLISNQLAGLDSYLESKKLEMADELDESDEKIIAMMMNSVEVSAIAQNGSNQT